MVRFFCIVIILLVIVGAVITATRQDESGKPDFSLSLADDIESLDPAQMVYHDEMRIGMGLWESLASYHPQTSEPISGAAELPASVSGDGLTYTFTLRPQARWSNGDPVTALDFVYAWRRAIEPGTAGDYAFFITDNIAGAKNYQEWRFAAIRMLGGLRDLAQGKSISAEDQAWLANKKISGQEMTPAQLNTFAQAARQEHLEAMDREFGKVGIKALDDHHLKVTLIRPLPYFVDMTCMSVFFPVHRESLEKLRVSDDPSVTELTLCVYDPQWVKPDYHKNGYPGLITNGEFFLKERRFKQYILLEKNPYYWDAANVRLERVMAKVILTPSSTFLAYEKGDLDWFINADRLDFAPTLVEQMRAGQRNDIHIFPAFATYYYSFNCQSALPDGRKNPFADARVRMAFNLAVDKQSIVDNVRRLGNPVARNLVPPGTVAGYSCPPGPDYDPQKAKQLLAEAGYPAGHNLPSIELLYNTGAYHEPIAEAVAEMWTKTLGARVLLLGKEIKSYEEDRKNCRYMVCRSGWYGDYLDPTTFLDTLITGNGNNKSGFSCKAYDELMQRAAACLDAGQRITILAQAEQMILDQQSPLLPIFYYVNLHAYRPEIQGIYPNPRDMHPYKYIRICGN
jgi:oligopeptide transport system substrate-binding protein